MHMDMNENKDQMTHTCGKNCMCGHSHSMRWLIRIAAVVIIFCLGFMMGELHTIIRGYEGGAGRGMMFHGRTMMNGYYDYAEPGATTGAAPATQAPAAQ